MIGGTLAATYCPNAPFFGRVIGRGPRQRDLYLTFDDGPNPRSTPIILDTLAAHNVPAAFFLVGRHVRLFPDLAERATVAGHLIGNHTMTHRKLHLLGPAAIAGELNDAHAWIEDSTRTSPAAFRAPHGYRNPFVADAARGLGYRTIGWTFGVWDSDPIPSEEIRRRVRSRLRPGAIILLHDGDGYDPDGDRRATAGAIAGIVRDALDAGYRFRRLDEIWQE